MPLYEYQCEGCGGTFEELVSLADRDNGQECPKCHSKRARRVVSLCAVGTGSNSGSAARGAPT
jgi:putative FmdB family regulatory protein